MYNKQLDTFIRAAEFGSLSKAAEALYITPSAVIQQINNLEASLDIKLFHRTNHGISLTEAGEYLLNEGKSLITKSNDIREHLSLLKGQAAHHITVGTNTYHVPRKLYELWFRFDMQFPEYTISTVPIGDITGEKLDDIDLIEGSRFFEAWQKDYEFFPCENVPLSIALPPDHPAAEIRLLQYSDLIGTPVVTIKEGIDPAIDAASRELEKAGISTIPVDIYDVSVAIMCLTRQYALAIPSCWKTMDLHLKLIPFDWDFSVQYGFFFRRAKTPSLQKFYDFVVQSSK